MARTSLTITDVDTGSAINPVSYDTGDSTNDNKFTNDGNTVLVLHNDTGAAVSVTIVSVPDEAGRTGDISISVANGDEVFIPPLQRNWWNQSDGTVHVDVDGSIKIAALRLP